MPKDTAMPQHTLLTADETAELLRVNRATIFRMLRAHKLARVKVQGKTLIPRSSIDAYLEAQTSPAR
jgi:excisionase family DNA binding protein